MAWLARSIANSLKLDEEDEDDDKHLNQQPSESVSDSQSPRGVKEDISELTKTLRTQFWGVASFLSQPSSSPDLQERNQTPDHPEEDEDLIAGIKNDFAEIGGRFRTGISKLSGNLPVSEFTKIASNFLQLSSEDVDPKDYDVIGVTEELVAFVKDLAMHPETWLDFPLPDDDDSFDDFELADAQYEHALAVERLAPSLASLRIELCPKYMTENCFWRIYFVLVHRKLSKDHALLLSTPQVLEARSMLSQELQKRSKLPVEAGSSEANTVIVEPLTVPPSPETAAVKIVNPVESSDVETDKHPIESKEIQIVDKSVIEERSTSTASSSRFINVQVDDEDDDDADDWLNDEETSSVSAIGGRSTTNHPFGEDEEDVSFSDLEEEDDNEGDVKVSYKNLTNSGSDSSDKKSPDWVQLKEVKEKKKSNDWLDVDAV
ncbi:putative BSD domain-containing protein [Arabidopsis thaliana]